MASPDSDTTASASDEYEVQPRRDSGNSARAVATAAAPQLTAPELALQQQPQQQQQAQQQSQQQPAMQVERSSDSGTALDSAAGVNKRSKEQEKNRRAQARFRERQKMKHGETERRMQELEEAVQVLQVERNLLAVKAETLERCLLQGDLGTSEGQEGGRKASKGPTFADYVQWYQGYVQQLAPLLVQAQFDQQSVAGKKIIDLWGIIVKEGVTFYREESLRAKIYSEPLLPVGEPQPPRPDKALWRQVTAALQLTEAQVQRCHAVRASYIGAMAGIMAQRQALNAVMQDMPDCDANAKVALHTAKASEAIQRLQANLRQEQVLQSELAIEVFERLLTPIQAATAMVGLNPYVPDKLAILDCACSNAATQ